MESEFKILSGKTAGGAGLIHEDINIDKKIFWRGLMTEQDKWKETRNLREVFCVN
jgi:hypothetical protein